MFRHVRYHKQVKVTHGWLKSLSIKLFPCFICLLKVLSNSLKYANLPWFVRHNWNIRWTNYTPGSEKLDLTIMRNIKLPPPKKTLQESHRGRRKRLNGLQSQHLIVWACDCMRVCVRVCVENGWLTGGWKGQNEISKSHLAGQAKILKHNATRL